MSTYQAVLILTGQSQAERQTDQGGRPRVILVWLHSANPKEQHTLFEDQRGEVEWLWNSWKAHLSCLGAHLSE